MNSLVDRAMGAVASRSDPQPGPSERYVMPSFSWHGKEKKFKHTLSCLISLLIVAQEHVLDVPWEPWQVGVTPKLAPVRGMSCHPFPGMEKKKISNTSFLV